MATVSQQPAGQPMFAPPGVAPQVANAQMSAMAPGSVLYYPQMAGSGGALIMPMPIAAVTNQPPKYEYTPNDFMVLSVITVILCGIFSPLSLLLSLPALFFSQQSKKSTAIGAVKVARKQGMIAAYLNAGAVIAAAVIACLVMGLALGLYGPVHVQEEFCKEIRNDIFSRTRPYNYQQNSNDYDFDDVCI